MRKFRKDLAKWIREERLARGLSQWALADAIGVSQVSISHWERGKFVPSALQVEAMTTLFKRRAPNFRGARVTDRCGRVRRCLPGLEVQA